MPPDLLSGPSWPSAFHLLWTAAIREIRWLSRKPLVASGASFCKARHLCVCRLRSTSRTRVVVQRGHLHHRHGDLTMGGTDFCPVSVLQVVFSHQFGRDIKAGCAQCNWRSQAFLCTPTVIHGHWALGQGVDGEPFIALLVGFVPDRQRIHGVLDALAQVLGRLAVSVTFGSQLETAHRFGIELEQIWAEGCHRCPSPRPSPDTRCSTACSNPRLSGYAPHKTRRFRYTGSAGSD